jgi:hypothetical protein
MSLADCIAEVIQASGGILTKDEAKELLNTYKEAVEGLSLQDRFATLDAILAKAHQQQIDGLQLSLLRERYVRTTMVMDRQRYDTQFTNAAKQGNNPIHREFMKAMTKAESIVESLKGEPAWWFHSQLDKNEGAAMVAMKDPSMMAQATDLFFEPKSSRSFEGVRPEVRALVEALDSTTDFIYSMANKNKGYLNWRPTILFSGRAATSEAVGAMSKQEFVDFTTDLMDDDVANLAKHGFFKHDDLVARLETLHDLMRDGKQYQVNGAFEDSTGPMIKALHEKTVNKISDSVFDLPFKDGAAYRQYFERLNGGDVAEHLFGQVHQVGRNLGMVQAFGVVPEKGLKTMIAAAQAAAETDAEKALIAGKFFSGHLNSEPSQKWAFLGKGAAVPDMIGKGLLIGKSWLTEPSPEAWFKALSGESSRVNDQGMADFFKAARGFVSVGKLIGTGHLTQWGDLPTTMAILGKLDDNPVASVQKSMELYLKAYDPNVKWDADALRSLGTSLDMMQGLQADMYYSGDHSPLSKSRVSVFDKAFKYTGMQRLDWVRISGINHYLNGRMAGWLDGDFAALTPEVKKLLADADIGEADWAALKTGVQPVPHLDGQVHLLPEMIKDHALRSKYLRMQREVNRIAVPRPGAREQALINRGTRPGTVEGEFWRTIGLFKSFGIAMATRVLPWVGENLSRKGQLTWAASMVGTYIIRDALKQVTMGKSPKDLRDVKTWKEALIFSGMGGVYGDMIGQDMSKFGATGGVAGAVAGPLITGPVQQGVDLFATLAKPENTGEKKVRKTVETGIKMTGADRLPLITPAMNKLWLYSFYESMEPGWMQRHLGGLKSRGQTEF